MQRNTLGNRGESLARDYLVKFGYEILHTNWRYGKYGEIDIIAYSSEELQLTFVEVKTRRTESYGTSLEAVTAVKQNKIRLLAEVYLTTHPITHPFNNISFDVITITTPNNNRNKYQSPTITHYKSAF